MITETAVIKTIYFKKEQFERMEEIREQMGVSRSKFVQDALEQYMIPFREDDGQIT